MIEVRDYGGEGPDVLLIHGLEQNLEVWQLVAPLLESRYRVVAVDLPGFGAADPDDVGEPSLDGFASALDDTVASLGLDLSLVVGHSFGSTVGAHLLDRLPGSPTLVIVEGFVGDPGGMLKAMGSDAPPSSFFDIGPFEPPAFEDWLADMRVYELEEEWPAAERIYRRSFPLLADGLHHLRPSAALKTAMWRELWDYHLTDVLRSLPRRPRIALALHPPVPDSARWLGLEADAAEALGVQVEWFDTGHAIPLRAPGKLAAWLG